MQDIDLYYESLKQVYEQIKNWPKRKPSRRERIIDWLVGITGVIFFLSLIPVLPVIFVFVGSQFGLVLGPLDLRVATLGKFVLVWIVATVIGAIFFFSMLWINDRVDSKIEKPSGPPQTLSPDQVTFIAVYEAYKELKIYFVSHIDQHVENALRSLRRVSYPDWWGGDIAQFQRLRFPEEPESVIEYQGEDDEVEFTYRMRVHSTLIQRKLSASFPRQIYVARAFLQTFETYSWFTLDTATKAVLQALISFPEKIPYRLRERQDLPSVLNVLKNLSEFVYAFLPEHQTHMDSATLTQLHFEGLERLHSFVQGVNDLTHYPPAPKQAESTSKIPPLTWREKLQLAYYHSIFVRFTLWFILILVLTSGTVLLINRFVALSSDTMATLIIGTSVASAAALAGFLPRSSKPE
jgi:hypothetical protein